MTWGGLVIREATVEDLPAIERIARYSFPVPDWLFSFEGNRAHYRPGGVTQGTHISLAYRGDEYPTAYIYYQLLGSGCLHIQELAAVPPPPGKRLPGAGTRLLMEAAEAALQNGANTVSLTVTEPHRVCVPGIWRDPTTFYMKFGFAECAHTTSFAGDIRLCTHPRDLLRRTQNYLLSAKEGRS